MYKGVRSNLKNKTTRNFRRLKRLEKKFTNTRNEQLDLEVQSQETLEYIVSEIQQLKRKFFELSEAVTNEIEKKDEQIKSLIEENKSIRKETRRELMSLKYRYTMRIKHDNEDRVKDIVREEIKGMFIDAKHEIKKELRRRVDSSVVRRTDLINRSMGEEDDITTQLVMRRIREIQSNLKRKSEDIASLRKNMNKVISYIKRKLEPKISNIDMNQSTIQAELQSKTLLGIINN